MSKKKGGHPNEIAMRRLNRQAKAAARRKPPATSDSGSRPSPHPRSIGPEQLTPGLPPWDGDPFAGQGTGEFNPA